MEVRDQAAQRRSVAVLVGDLDGARMPAANTLVNIAERLSGSFGIALLTTFYSARIQLTGSAVAALHDCALLLAAVSAGGALTALMLRGPCRQALPTGRSSCDDGMRAANDAG